MLFNSYLIVCVQMCDAETQQGDHLDLSRDEERQ